MKKNKLKKVSLKIKETEKEDSKKSSYVKLIKENLETPISTLQFSSLLRPVYFPNSSIPRYKISILIDDNLKDHREFLENLENIAIKEKVPTIGKRMDDGLILITLQGKNKVSTYIKEGKKKKEELVDLEHDAEKGFKCKIFFDLNTYYNKFNKKNAFNFSPKKVIFYLDENFEKQEVENGNSENFGD